VIGVLPYARFVAACKAGGWTISRTSDFLVSAGFPDLSDSEWEESSTELIERFGTELIALIRDEDAPPDYKAALKMFKNSTVLFSIVIMLNQERGTPYIVGTLARSGLGDYSVESVNLFQQIFWDTSLTTEEELIELANKCRPDMRDAIIASLNNNSVSLLIDYHLIPQVSAEEYLSLMMSAGVKTLYDYINGNIEIENPYSIIAAGLKAAEILKKDKNDMLNEFVDTIQKLSMIQSNPMEQTDQDIYVDDLISDEQAINKKN